jgi:hypothetical protein
MYGMWMRNAAAALALVLALIVCWFGAVGGAEQAKPGEDAKRKAGPTKVYYGAALCADCHSKGTQLKDPVCLCKEYPIWEKKDRHPLAYKVLEGERGQSIGKLLNIKVTEDKRCLSCHGVVIADEEVKKRSENAQFKIEEGVSCAVCHGPYQDWYQKHSDPFQRGDWRKKTREQRETEFGMTDLWHPGRRATLCASCHVGNGAEGKVLTHEMYAAGHPPLPSFELATFGDAMPRHWQLLSEKEPAAQKALEYDPAELEQTRLVIEGSVAIFREAVRLLGSQAEANEKETEVSKRLLDLAQFDCYACHHELRVPGWRAARGYVGKPGRPQMRPWSSALVRLGIRQAAGDDEVKYQKLSQELQGHLQALYAACERQPFGDAKEIAPAARRLVEWVDALLKGMGQSKYDQPAARRALRELTTGRAIVDYDTARQIAWSIQVVYRELQPKPATEAKIPGLLAELNEALGLNLSRGGDAPRAPVSAEELDKTLRLQNEYTPELFLAKVKRIGELLPDENR